MKELDKDLDLIFAENDTEVNENDAEYYQKKLEDLSKLGILRHSWSIIDIYNRIRKETIIYNVDYQREYVWKDDRITPFIESLFMGIQIPPIYLSENKPISTLDEVTYEVVDGKQRLRTIYDFLSNKTRLEKRYLKYFKYQYGEMTVKDIEAKFKSELDDMLSNVIDVYVIKSSSPSSAKYDIFARLNKGSAPLSVGALRKSVYKSPLTEDITSLYIELTDSMKLKFLAKRFSNKYELFLNRMYRSLAFYANYDAKSNSIRGYNSRLGDLINETLHRFQVRGESLDNGTLHKILTFLDELYRLIVLHKVEKSHIEYTIDTFMPYVDQIEFREIEKVFIKLLEQDNFKSTFLKSSSTTSNVDKRLQTMSGVIKVTVNE